MRYWGFKLCLHFSSHPTSASVLPEEVTSANLAYFLLSKKNKFCQSNINNT